MLFGSAIFIFTLFFFLQFFKMLQCFSFCFHVFICDWVVMNQNFFFFVSKYVRRHKVQILCEVFTFSPAFKFFTKVWNFKEKRKKKKACSTSDLLTTSLLDHFFFFACVFIPQTATRTYRSWTRVCWHSLIIYVLTCPNADITRPHVLRLFASSHSLLLLLDRDLLFVKHVHKKIPVWFVWKNYLLNMSAHYL